MSESEQTTLERIHTAAKCEFLEKGFTNASLRNIVKTAGVTTRSFLRILFKQRGALCLDCRASCRRCDGKVYDCTNRFCRSAKGTAARPYGKESGDCISWMIDYMYDHFEDFKILICCSEGTSYETFIHSMVEIEVEYTFRYVDVLKSLGNEIPELDRDLCHMIASGMFEGVFEVIRHDMSKERAKIFVASLREFYTAGWMKIMGQ